MPAHRPLMSTIAAGPTLLVAGLALAISSCASGPETRADARPMQTAQPSLPSTPTPDDVESRPGRRTVPARPTTDHLVALEDDGSLMAGLASADARTRWIAARALGQLDAAGAANVLAQRAAAERDPAVLAMMLFALGQSGNKGVTNVFLPMLSHGDARVRAAAVEGLGKTHDDAHTSRVVAMLEDIDASVRGHAALALFRFDGRRYEHSRRASAAVRKSRDEALIRVLLQDSDEGVRWRVAYTLSNVPVHGVGMQTALQLAMKKASTDTRVFALAALGQIAADGHVSQPNIDEWLASNDIAVATAAAGALGTFAPASRLVSIALDHATPQVRHRAAHELAQRIDPKAKRRAGVADGRNEAMSALAVIVERAPGGVVERIALDALSRYAGAPVALERLATSSDALHREAAAVLLADEDLSLENAELVVRLARDASPRVRAAAFPALTNPDHVDGALHLALADALRSRDPALVAGAAKAAAAHSAKGRVHPEVLRAIADAVELTDVDASFVEARADVRAAFGLDPATDTPGAPPALGTRLLDHLVALDREAQADPHPTATLSTSKGSITLRLDRVAAPVHVKSFLEQARNGEYDDTTFHRIVPGFGAQGLDPLGHGWGTNGRRVPDEFGARGFESGTVGMPHSGNPHSGGCQIFVTHVPTPHLDGNYTVFGEVTSGMDVVQRLEIGDRVSRVR